mmetsp:Transcript_5819/g.19521  ORF Transcript_5819/g.19521 Transcript_5819/m.19521 type:complete len:204 (+) Transcript_5819:857-1468(+)
MLSELASFCPEKEGRDGADADLAEIVLFATAEDALYISFSMRRLKAFRSAFAYFTCATTASILASFSFMSCATISISSFSKNLLTLFNRTSFSRRIVCSFESTMAEILASSRSFCLLKRRFDSFSAFLSAAFLALISAAIRIASLSAANFSSSLNPVLTSAFAVDPMARAAPLIAPKGLRSYCFIIMRAKNENVTRKNTFRNV